MTRINFQTKTPIPLVNQQNCKILDGKAKSVKDILALAITLKICERKDELRGTGTPNRIKIKEIEIFKQTANTLVCRVDSSFTSLTYLNIHKRIVLNLPPHSTIFTIPPCQYP